MIRAVVVFVAICLLWLTLFVIFSPWLLLAQAARLWRRKDRLSGRRGERRGRRINRRRRRSTHLRSPQRCFQAVRLQHAERALPLDSFFQALEGLQSEFDRPRALDFGAGSLRDSYELASRGFEVVSFDLNERILRRYFDSYDWTVARYQPKLLAGSLEDLRNDLAANSVQVVLAFDVIEHLEDPASYVQTLSRLLCERGFLFTIVPNKRSLF